MDPWIFAGRIITDVSLLYRNNMHALRHQISVTYIHQPARRHLVPMIIRLFCSSVSLRAISSLIPVVEPNWPREGLD